MNTNLRNQLLKKLGDKEYRDNFVREYIFSRIPLKIRAMREERHVSQHQLGELAGIAQPWVSKLEDPNYGRLTLSTLLKIASAFDVALHVDFVAFSEILNRSSSLSEGAFAVPSYARDKELVPSGASPSETEHPKYSNVSSDNLSGLLNGKKQGEEPEIAPAQRVPSPKTASVATAA